MLRAELERAMAAYSGTVQVLPPSAPRVEDMAQKQFESALRHLRHTFDVPDLPRNPLRS